MNTKEKRYMQQCYIAYIKNPNRSIFECYKNPSLLKVNAYQNCVTDELNNGGRMGGVISYNADVFVYAYANEFDFVVITPSRKLIIPLKEVRGI